MGMFREEEGSSGLEGLDDSIEWNTMHGFWLRFAVAQVSTFVWGIILTKMIMYGLNTNLLWLMGFFVTVSLVAWTGSARQLIMDSRYSAVTSPPSEDMMTGRDTPW